MERMKTIKKKEKTLTTTEKRKRNTDFVLGKMINKYDK